MSRTDYTTTPNLGLYKPIYNHDYGQWATHLNANADTLDAALATGAGGLFLPLAGGHLSGPLTLAADPTVALGAATKQYVDSHSGTGGGIADAPSDSNTYGRLNAAWTQVLPRAGGTMTGALHMGSNVLDGSAIAFTGGSLNGVTVGATTPAAGTFTLTKATRLQESSVALGAGSAIDCNAGALFSKTITAATTFTVANVPAGGTVACFMLDLTNGGAYTITWWANLKWPGGVAPTLSSTGRDVLGFYTVDAGTTWNGFVLGRAMA